MEVCHEILVAEKCKPYEIYRRMCDVYGEAYFRKKKFTNGLNVILPLQTWSQKTVHQVETVIWP